MTVERTIRYATSVLELNEAWAFVMSRIDELGPSPRIEISPIWVYVDGAEDVRKFDVMVSGSVEEV